MKIASIITFLLLGTYCFPQVMTNYGSDKPPVFRLVSYPFLPVLTAGFFFSSDGLMWFSTAKGLASFDGTAVIYHCSLQESIELGLNRIDCFAEDKNQGLYLVTGGNKIVYFNRKARTFSSIKNLISASRWFTGAGITFIKVDNTGVLYFGTNARGMFIYYPTRKKIEHVNLLAGKPDEWESRYDNTARSFADHKNDSNKFWLGSFNGIYLFDKKNKSLTRKFVITDSSYDHRGVAKPYCDVQKMDIANDSTIWFNMWTGGFCRYNTRTGMVTISKQTVIPSFERLTSGNYLLGVFYKHPCIYNIKTNKTLYFNVTADPDAPDRISFSETDRNGNIWLLRNGLLYVSIPGYSRLQPVSIAKQFTADFAPNELRGIYYDEETRFYYCAVRHSSGIFVLDTNFAVTRIIPAPLFTNYYTYKETCTDKIAKDGSGRFWVTGQETYIMLPGQNKFSYIGHIFPQLAWLNKKKGFVNILATKNGDIALQEDDSSSFFLIHHKTLLVDTIKIPRSDNTLNYNVSNTTFCYDSLRDYIYAGSDKGIVQYHLKEKKIRGLSYPGISGAPHKNQSILKFAIDSNGKIWLLKDEYGLQVFDAETLKCCDSVLFGEKGLHEGYYSDIAGAAGEYMLLRGPQGVVIYNYKKQQSFLFDSNNGLSFPKPVSMLYCNNHLLLGQLDRIEYYNVTDVYKNDLTLQPQLNSIIADTTEINISPTSNSKIALPYYKNTISLSFSALEFVFPERIEYAYQLSGVDIGWKYSNYFNRKINYSNLQPGTYVLKLKARQSGGNWNSPAAEYSIIITPPFWQTGWFMVICFLMAAGIIFILLRWRTGTILKQERVKAGYEKELMELEARALRAQMNPHFIFNCLNSIKSLIQEHEDDKAITYLTTFSKLIRTLFNNADKKEISLFDEIETCRLYLRLEAMRFDAKFTWSITVNENLDLKSIPVPALVIQPFIENAICHGIIPHNTGGHISLAVIKKDKFIEIVIDDNGIGRKASQQNKPASGLAHQSKGVNLTQSRLELNNLLLQRQASIETIDKKDETGKATGTKIIIKIKEEV